MNDAYSYEGNEKIWEVVRELIDNHLEPDSFSDLVEANWLMSTGKYAASEPFYESGIQKLNLTKELLEKDKEALVSALGKTDVDLNKVWDFARHEIAEQIESAENGYKYVKGERKKGIDEIPAEERYNEIIRMKKAYERGVRVWALCSVLVTIVLSLWAYTVSLWIVAILIVVCIIVVFVAFLRMSFGIEHLIHIGDTEMQEFAKKDGWWK